MNKRPPERPVGQETVDQIRERGIPAVAAWSHAGHRIIVIGAAGPYGRLLCRSGTGPSPGVDLRAHRKE